MVEKLANEMIKSIESFGLQERCKNYGETWEDTKERFLDEARRGKKNQIFWLIVGNFAEVLENYTK